MIIEDVRIENPALLIYIFEGEENETRREQVSGGDISQSQCKLDLFVFNSP